MLQIRTAQPEDAGTILKLIRGLAEYEHEPESAQATEADLLRDGFGPNPKFHCAIADWEGTPAGFALYFHNYSTWKGRSGIFLEDIFVWPEYRGKGIGKALLVHLARVALKNNCGRLVWQVLDWNMPSIKFYESLGAQTMKEWLTMRVTDEALVRLATEHSAVSAQPSAASD